MKYATLLIVSLAFFAACTTEPSGTAQEEKIKISDIAFQSEEDVAAVLGVSEGVKETEKGPKHSYKEGRFEVVYINGKADWIKINNYWEDIDLSEIRSYVSVHTLEDHVMIKASTP